MTIGYNIVIVYLLTVFSRTQSQFYGQYGYQPNYQYPVYNPSYVPYPYVTGQSYQPYVSTLPSYFPYYNSYPLQNYPTQNYLPQYSTAAQPSQVFYPAFSPGAEYATNAYSSYLPASVVYTPVSQALANAEKSGKSTENDPYANVRTDIIDVEPQYFHYYKRFFNLEDNSYPIEVIDGDSRAPSEPLRTNGRPSYIVKTESKQTNLTNIPHGIKKHDIQTKTFSFKKTFTIDPTRKENAVINLNFVNGVEVTTKKPEASANSSDSANVTISPIQEDDEITTTESEEPEHVNGWFG